MKEDLAGQAAIVRGKLARFIKDGRISAGAAQRLISDAAWWYGHPHGPTRAPDHYKRVTFGRHGWEIEFGANSFLVGHAISRCITAVERAVNQVLTTGSKVQESRLREEMTLAVRGAVANFDGNEYQTYYDVHKGFMHFGTQAINVDDFVRTIWTLTEAHRICSARDGK